MFKIYTNIFKKIKPENKKDFKVKLKSLGNFEIGDYEQKTLGENVSKYIVDSLDIYKYTEDLKAWDKMENLITQLYHYSQELEPKREAQFWIKDTSQKPSINIAFNLTPWINQTDLLAGLYSILQSVKGKKYSSGIDIIWISFDPE